MKLLQEKDLFRIILRLNGLSTQPLHVVDSQTNLHTIGTIDEVIMEHGDGGYPYVILRDAVEGKLSATESTYSHIDVCLEHLNYTIDDQFEQKEVPINAARFDYYSLDGKL
jgi:hypothetical protein